ncbi:MAG: hypothetical protein H6633_15290 [Anaerolineales bacterium]|nr:hypothetical protein [Anaerolineales bacterium]
MKRIMLVGLGIVVLTFIIKNNLQAQQPVPPYSFSIFLPITGKRMVIPGTGPIPGLDTPTPTPTTSPPDTPTPFDSEPRYTPTHTSTPQDTDPSTPTDTPTPTNTPTYTPTLPLFPGNFALSCLSEPTLGNSLSLRIFITTSVPVPGPPGSASFHFDLTSQEGPIDNILKPASFRLVNMFSGDVTGNSVGDLVDCDADGTCTATYTITSAVLYNEPLTSVIGETVMCTF